MSLILKSQNPTITAGAYEVGDAVGGKLTFADIVEGGARHGAIRGCRIVDKGRQSVPLELWLFREDFTPANDNAVFSPSDSDLANLAAVVRVTDWFHAAGNSAGQAEDLPQTFTLNAGDKTLYGQLVARGTPTYASTSDLAVELVVDQSSSAIARRSRRYFAPKQYPPLTPLTITATANYHTIHLKFEFTDPANLPANTAQVTGSYLLNGRWVDFHPTVRRDAGGTASLYTILFGLSEGKTYPVKLVFTRTNNATGAIIERRTFHKAYTTRTSPQSLTGGSHEIFISPSGNDSNDGSSGSPKKTLAGAISGIGTKKTITLKNGDYTRAAYGGDGAILSIVTNGAGSPKCRINFLSAHGRAVGDTFVVRGSGVVAYNTTHTVQSLGGSSTVLDTDIAFTPGSNGGECCYWGTQWFDEMSSWDISDLDGTASEYKTVRSENPASPGAVITGKKLLSGLTWTKHTTNYTGGFIYYADFRDFIDFTSDPKRGPRFMRNELTGYRLYFYEAGLAADAIITGISASGTTYTITTSAAHGLSTGDQNIAIGGIVGSGNMPNHLNQFGLSVASTPTSTTFTVTAWSGSATGTWTSGGWVQKVVNFATGGNMECEYLPIEGFLIDWTNKRVYVRRRALSGSITSSSDNTGAVRLTMSAPHGLVEGDRFAVSGHTGVGGAYDTVHKVTLKVSDTIVETDVAAGGDGSGGAWTMDVAPASGEYSASCYSNTACDLINCDFAIIDGLIVEMFGKVNQVGSGQYASAYEFGTHAMRIWGSNDVVVRNFQLTLANMAVSSNSQRVTIEDNTIEQNDLWGKFHANPMHGQNWDRVKESSCNETVSIQCNGHTTNDSTPQLVIRRNTLRKGYFAMIIGSATSTIDNENQNADVYENIIDAHLDQVFAVESETGLKNAAIWHNLVDGCLGFMDARNLGGGPVWVVANRCVNMFYWTIYRGDTPSDGWLLAYHNTFWSNITHVRKSSDGPHLWRSNGESNGHYRSNIYTGTDRHYFKDGLGGSSYAANVILAKNAFYTTYTTFPWPQWELHDSLFGTESPDLVNHVSGHPDAITLTANIYAINPYPSGINGALNSALQEIAPTISGITTIAADVSGVALNEPLALGHFPKWQS